MADEKKKSRLKVEYGREGLPETSGVVPSHRGQSQKLHGRRGLRLAPEKLASEVWGDLRYEEPLDSLFYDPRIHHGRSTRLDSISDPLLNPSGSNQLNQDAVREYGQLARIAASQRNRARLMETGDFGRSSPAGIPASAAEIPAPPLVTEDALGPASPTPGIDFSGAGTDIASSDTQDIVSLLEQLRGAPGPEVPDLEAIVQSLIADRQGVADKRRGELTKGRDAARSRASSELSLINAMRTPTMEEVLSRKGAQNQLAAATEEPAWEPTKSQKWARIIGLAILGGLGNHPLMNAVNKIYDTTMAGKQKDKLLKVQNLRQMLSDIVSGNRSAQAARGSDQAAVAGYHSGVARDASQELSGFESERAREKARLESELAMAPVKRYGMEMQGRQLQQGDVRNNIEIQKLEEMMATKALERDLLGGRLAEQDAVSPSVRGWSRVLNQIGTALSALKGSENLVDIGGASNQRAQTPLEAASPQGPATPAAQGGFDIMGLLQLLESLGGGNRRGGVQTAEELLASER